MYFFETILFVANTTPSNELALEQALTLAADNKAKLYVMHADKPLSRSMKATLKKLHVDYKQYIKEKLAAMLAKFPHENVEVELLVKTGVPMVEIVKAAVAYQADLVIKSSEDHPVHRLGFATLDMSLLRQCPKPVWLFKPNRNKRDTMKVLATVDPQEGDKTAMQLSSNIVQLSQNLLEAGSYHSLDIVHCWVLYGEKSMQESPFLLIPKEEIDELRQADEIDHEKYFQRVLQTVKLDKANCQTHMLNGDAIKLIPEFVKNHEIDLVVMGTVGRVGVEGFFIGNTAESILNSVNCSVLAMKPDGFKTSVRVA